MLLYLKSTIGYLEKDSIDYYKIVQYKLNLIDNRNMQQIIPDDIYKNEHLCHICRTRQPIRSRHCRFCERCVEEFDHHCIYLSK